MMNERAAAAPLERRQEILRERAMQLANPPQPVLLPEGLPVTCFTAAGADYAVETACVSEVFLLDEITAIPGAPPFLAGVVNRRGLILALFDLRELLNLPKHGITDIHAVVVLRSDTVELGLLADRLLGSALAPLEKMLPSSASGHPSEYLRGSTRDGLTLIDARRILSDDRLLLNATGAKRGGHP